MAIKNNRDGVELNIDLCLIKAHKYYLKYHVKVGNYVFCTVDKWQNHMKFKKTHFG